MSRNLSSIPGSAAALVRSPTALPLSARHAPLHNIPESAGPLVRQVIAPTPVKVPARPAKVPASHVGRVENVPHPAGGTMRVVRHPGSGQFMPKR